VAEVVAEPKQAGFRSNHDQAAYLVPCAAMPADGGAPGGPPTTRGGRNGSASVRSHRPIVGPGDVVAPGAARPKGAAIGALGGHRVAVANDSVCGDRGLTCSAGQVCTGATSAPTTRRSGQEPAARRRGSSAPTRSRDLTRSAAPPTRCASTRGT
jgi:hypothetical protein